METKNMKQLISELIIYRDLGEGCILYNLAEALSEVEKEGADTSALAGKVRQEIHRLLDLSTKYGFNENLWHNYLAFILAMTETPFTLVSEKVGAVEGSVNEFAKSDFAIFKKLFDYDFAPAEKALGTNCFSTILSYKAVGKSERIYNKSVSEKVQELSRGIENAADAGELYKVITDFYKKYGVVMFGLNKSFRVTDGGEELLVPITSNGTVVLSDLIGYEKQKQQLLDNTEAFVNGKKANNVLLYGDAGTGKSTSIKAILNQYYDQGLRMIEIYKHQSKDLSRVIDLVKNRNYRFIIYMDDLSFEEFETDYKYLKAVIEGGLEPKPDNVLIYATSNRQHLIKESWKDKNDHDGDVHRNDTIQEKLSLANRFGVQIGYFRPSPKEFYNIITELMKRHPEVEIPSEELMAEANKWQVKHASFSGRTAQQFVDYIVGTRG